MSRGKRNQSGVLRRAIKHVFTSTELMGALVFGIGCVIAFGAFEYLGNLDIVLGGVMVAVFGVALMFVGADDWYCQNCGQRLGKLGRPRSCNRCGSN